jgi:hypothetical protein
MGFQAIPTFGPLALEGGQTSSLYDFFVAEGVDETFLRFVALFRDNEPLGGDDPTFQIRAGTGQMSSVTPTSGEVPIRDGAGKNVGSVRCARTLEDMFLLTISQPGENAGPWKIRIRNNDPEPLRFLGFSSQHAEQTLQPWLVVGDSSIEVVSRESTKIPREIQIRNLGTAPVTLQDVPGTPLGERDSPVVLTSRPPHVDPHRVGTVMVSIGHVFSRRTVEHRLRSNDTNDAHGRLFVVVNPPQHVPEHHGDPPEDFCRTGCGCPGYIPPSHGPGGRCDRGTCRHVIASHRPV